MRRKRLCVSVGAAAVVAAIVVALCVRTAGAQIDSQHSRPSLRGLKGVHVLVLVIVGDENSDAEHAGLTRRQLQTQVELRLRKARIPVLSEEELLRSPGAPYLCVKVDARKVSEGLYAVFVRVTLTQQVLLLRDPKVRVPASTWGSTGVIGGVGESRLREIRDAVADEVDEFINAYLAVNPMEPTSRPAKP